MTDATAEQLGAVPILATCTPEELSALAERVHSREYPLGHEVLRQGEPGDTLYIIVRGEAEVLIDGVQRASLGAGDIVGEISMVGGGEATATVLVTSPLSTLTFTREDFSAVAQLYGGIALRVITVLVDRLGQNARQLAAYNRTLVDYIEQVRQVTSAAAAVEAATFQPQMLEGVAGRDDELGRLARVFERMAVEVATREQNLRREVQRLRITIDQSRTEEQVAAITETDYFQTLQIAADRMRSAGRGQGKDQ